MKWTEDKLDVLQNLEFSIVTVWRAHPEMTDHVAHRAYEAAFQIYRAEQRGHQPKFPTLTGLDALAFESLREMCEFRLGRGRCRICPALFRQFLLNKSLIPCVNFLSQWNATPSAAGDKVI